MSYVERHTVEVTTATGGGATAFTPVVMGRVANVIYTAAATGGFASTADFDVTAEETGLTIWDEDNVTASKTVAPVQVAHSTTGAALDTAGDDHRTPIFVANERIKSEVAQGGNTKDGTFTVVVA